MKETEPLHITPKVDVLELEMGSEDSITAFNARLQDYPSLDLVILNAGIYQTEFFVCENTGRERTLQVILLSNCATALLAIQLLLRQPTQGRLLIISSEAHAWANPQQKSFTALIEMLNQSNTYPCYARYHINPARVLMASATPGFCRSGLFRSFNGKTIADYLERLVCRTPDQGAWQYLTAIEGMNTAVHGCFFADGKFRPSSTAATLAREEGLHDSMWDNVLKMLPECAQHVAHDLSI
ncbi:uncharacterized protein BO87DRAFT_322298 [Aspergillus neoniger CBS 115656]|uniref:Short-chain dehydrogenase n=1 Tax=Aspergillus neoniger (strain CBS 115656) TaxID=1448310 RepID=A0A318YJE7_ASPNB|nr:hypothetical protein BO87DRAFT_322298 [Aspergillus neoniger CBS 115656]PYH28418.1 hypothetical protein BO87DRAFT_322298 [Aspergillus neoniger CBS 115656]